MPIFFQHSINADTHLGIWKIEEPEEFFLKSVPLKNQVTHPYKRLQHLAGRYLLPELYADFPVEDIMVADTRKPFLVNEKYHFSISHCGNFAAAIASAKNRVGVDIEIVTPTIAKVAPKFLNEKERAILSEWQAFPNLYLPLLTMVWSCKEAIFKWYGHGGVDFRRHISLQGEKMTIDPNETATLQFVFSRDQPIDLTVETKIFRNLILAWVVS